MSKWKILRRLFKYAYNYKLKVLFLLILGLISTGLGVLAPLPIKYIIDSVISGHALPLALHNLLSFLNIPLEKIQILIFFISAAIAMTFIKSVISLVSSRISAKVCQQMVY